MKCSALNVLDNPVSVLQIDSPDERASQYSHTGRLKLWHQNNSKVRCPQQTMECVGCCLNTFWVGLTSWEADIQRGTLNRWHWLWPSKKIRHIEQTDEFIVAITFIVSFVLSQEKNEGTKNESDLHQKPFPTILVLSCAACNAVLNDAPAPIKVFDASRCRSNRFRRGLRFSRTKTKRKPVVTGVMSTEEGVSVNKRDSPSNLLQVKKQATKTHGWFE